MLHIVCDARNFYSSETIVYNLGVAKKQFVDLFTVIRCLIHDTALMDSMASCLSGVIPTMEPVEKKNL